MATYKVKMWGETYVIAADFREASCPIEGDGHGRQVADFCHSPRLAMDTVLREMAEIYRLDPGEMLDDEIEEALDDMTVVVGLVAPPQGGQS